MSAILEELSEDECRWLLREPGIGRLAVVVAGEPHIFPVNFATSGDVVLFRTGLGLKLEQAIGHPVAFEVDGFDAAAKQRWSVVVHGRAVEITADTDPFAEDLRRVPVTPAVPGERLHWVAIYPTQLTGRRFQVSGDFAAPPPT
ncbi:MAG: pyridoxamine 5'-phosphate oxidase family protein [Chloroflexi bacterium]|nr:MAG: pyridoxamine 5'-phosphate oxidase family protein [Chloroflexota bacterium]